MTYTYNLYVYDCTYFKLLFYTSSREKNLVNQAAVFRVKNALKFTSDHLRLEKIVRGLYPRTPEGREEGRERKGRIGEGMGREREGGGGEGREGGEGLQPLQKCLLYMCWTLPFFGVIEKRENLFDRPCFITCQNVTGNV
jgi:hypothetical protein